MKTLTFLATVTAVAPFACLAQTADDLNAGMRIEHDESTGANTISWWGKENHVYVLQTSDPQLMNWTYIDDHIFVGEGAIEDSFSFTISGEPKRAFFKLHYSDAPVSDPANAGDLDIDGDGLSIQVEIENNTNPFSALDLSGNGIADEVDALWASVPSTWVDEILNDPNADYYDPDNLITTSQDVSPVDDYDGDGLSNLQEYLAGNPGDAIDFFNGETPVIQKIAGDNQLAVPQTFAEESLYVRVENSEGAPYYNAPVIFEVEGGYAGLANTRSIDNLQAKRLERTVLLGVASYFYAPNVAGDTTINVSLPTDPLVETKFTVTTDPNYTPPPYEFRKYELEDGNTKFTWRTYASANSEFRLREEVNGEMVVKLTLNYNQLAAPVDGNLYTVTVDENYNVVSQ